MHFYKYLKGFFSAQSDNFWQASNKKEWLDAFLKSKLSKQQF